MTQNPFLAKRVTGDSLQDIKLRFANKTTQKDIILPKRTQNTRPLQPSNSNVSVLQKKQNQVKKILQNKEDDLKKEPQTIIQTPFNVFANIKLKNRNSNNKIFEVKEDDLKLESKPIKESTPIKESKPIKITFKTAIKFTSKSNQIQFDNSFYLDLTCSNQKKTINQKFIQNNQKLRQCLKSSKFIQKISQRALILEKVNHEFNLFDTNNSNQRIYLFLQQNPRSNYIRQNQKRRIQEGFRFYRKIEQLGDNHQTLRRLKEIFQIFISDKSYQSLINSLVKRCDINVICAFYLLNTYFRKKFNIDLQSYSKQNQYRVNDDAMFHQQMTNVILEQLIFLLKIYNLNFTRKIQALFLQETQYSVMQSLLQPNQTLLTSMNVALNVKQSKMKELNDKILNLVLQFYQRKYKIYQQKYGTIQKLQDLLNKAINYFQQQKIKNKLFQLRIILQFHNYIQYKHEQQGESIPNLVMYKFSILDLTSSDYGPFQHLFKYLRNQLPTRQLYKTLQHLPFITQLQISIWFQPIVFYLSNPQSKGVFKQQKKEKEDESVLTDLQHCLIIIKLLQKLQFTLDNFEIQSIQKIRKGIQEKQVHKNIIKNLLNQYIMNFITTKPNHLLFSLVLVINISKNNKFTINDKIICLLMKKIKGISVQHFQNIFKIFCELNKSSTIKQIILGEIPQQILRIFPDNKISQLKSYLVPLLVFQLMSKTLKSTKSYAIKETNKLLIQNYMMQRQNLIDQLSENDLIKKDIIMDQNKAKICQIRRTFKFCCQMFSKMQIIISSKSLNKIQFAQNFINFLNQSLETLYKLEQFQENNKKDIQLLKQKLLEQLFVLYNATAINYLQNYSSNILPQKCEQIKYEPRCIIVTKIINFYCELLCKAVGEKNLKLDHFFMFKQFFQRYQKYIVFQDTNNFPQLLNKASQITRLLSNSLKYINSFQTILPAAEITDNINLISCLLICFQKQLLHFVKNHFQQDSSVTSFVDLYLNFIQDLQFCQVKLSSKDTLKTFQESLIQILLEKSSGQNSTLPQNQKNTISQQKYQNWYNYINLMKNKHLSSNLKGMIMRKMNSQVELNQKLQEPERKNIIQISIKFFQQFLNQTYLNSKPLSKSWLKYFFIWITSLTHLNKSMSEINCKNEINNGTKQNICKVLFENSENQVKFIEIYSSLSQMNTISFKESNSFSIIQRNQLLDLSLKCLQGWFSVALNMSRSKMLDIIDLIGDFFCSLVQNQYRQEFHQKFMNIMVELLQFRQKYVFQLKLQKHFKILKGISKLFLSYFNILQAKTHINFIVFIDLISLITLTKSLPQADHQILEYPNLQNICFLIQTLISTHKVSKQNGLNYFLVFQKVITTIRKLIHLSIYYLEELGDEQKQISKRKLAPYLNQLLEVVQELIQQSSEVPQKKVSLIQSNLIFKNLYQELVNMRSSSEIQKGSIANLLVLTNLNIIKHHLHLQKFQSQFKIYRNTFLEIQKFEFITARQFYQNIRLWELIISFMVKFRNFLTINSEFSISSKLIFLQNHNRYLNQEDFSDLIQNLKMIQRLQFYDQDFNNVIKKVHNKQITNIHPLYEGFIQSNLKLIAVTSDIFCCLLKNFVEKKSNEKQLQQEKLFQFSFQKIIEKLIFQIITSRGLEFVHQNNLLANVKFQMIRNFQKVVLVKSVVQFLNLCLQRKLLTNFHVNRPLKLMEKIIKFKFNQNLETSISCILLQNFNFRSLINNFSIPNNQLEQNLKKITLNCQLDSKQLNIDNKKINLFQFHELIAKLQFIYNVLILFAHLRCFQSNKSEVKQIIKKTDLFNVSLDIVHFLYFNFIDQIKDTNSKINRNFDQTYDEIQKSFEVSKKSYSSKKHRICLLQFAPTSNKTDLQKLILNVMKTIELFAHDFNRKQTYIFNDLTRKITLTSTMSSFQIGSIQKEV